MTARTDPPVARGRLHVDPAPEPHYAIIDPATGRIETVSGPSMGTMAPAMLAALKFQPIPAAVAHEFHADPVDRCYINGMIGRCASTRLRMVTEFRTKRAAILANTDYLMAGDAPIAAAKIAAWKVYRQALRDITKQPGYPQTITWPTPPT